MALTGLVKNISPCGGHGFIKQTDGPDVFFDTAGLEPAVQRGQRLSFDIVDKGRGPRAVNVKRPPNVGTPLLNREATADRAEYVRKRTR